MESYERLLSYNRYAGMMRLPSILWIPHISWTFPQRARLFCDALVPSCEVHALDFFAGSRKMRDYLTPRYLNSYVPKDFNLDGVTIHHVPRISPSLFLSGIRRLNDMMMQHFTDKIVQSCDIDNVVGSYVCPPPKCRRLIFDIFDPNPQLWRESGTPFKGIADEILMMESKYMTAADSVTAAGTILAMMHPARDDIVVIPNGVNLADYSVNRSHRFRRELDSGDSAVAVYSGNLGYVEEIRLLYDSFRIAGKSADIILYLVGAGNGHDWIRRQSKKDSVKNIRFLGSVPKAMMPELLSSVDVGLCPYGHHRSSWISNHLVWEIEESDAPMLGGSMKIIEYSAAGIPVVCTDQIAYNRMNLDNVVFTGFTPNEFGQSIVMALDSKRKRPSIMKEYDLPLLVSRFRRLLTD